VKNLYHDVMKDAELSQFIPSFEQNSKKYPERDFFFGVMATVRGDYLKTIIEHAHKQRFGAGAKGKEQDGIQLSDQWLEELMKHPFISSKLILLIILETPGKAIFLMKHKSKLTRERKNVKVFELGAKLNDKRLYEEQKHGDQ
jgi:hypothetical protein